MTSSSYPLLYQLNTRIRQHELACEMSSSLTLNDWPDSEWERLAELGFDWVWLLGVWETGKAGRHVSRTQPDWQAHFRACLPDLAEADICGSCFAITRYQVAENLGGNEALQQLRHKLNKRGLRLMLDFVPNHTALDHPWVQTHPEFYIRGTPEDLQRAPQNYIALASSAAGTDQQIFAYGRDPYFDGWPDTLQLDYSNPAVQQAMRETLLNIAGLCDGVRCDMAMLLLPQVFERTWQRSITPFWLSTIAAVRKQFPDLLFLAEVYWDLEWTLQQQGFDYTYDKRLYDRLRDRAARPVRDHLTADISYQRKLTRFLENHDEPRAAAIFPPAVHQAAAIINYFAPGMRFFHAGQLEGKRISIPIHLCRGPVESADTELNHFYQKLLQTLRNPLLRQGSWQLLECSPAQANDDTWKNFIAYRWQEKNGNALLVIVNYAPLPGRCQLALTKPQPEMNDKNWCNLMQSDESIAVQTKIITQLRFDLPAWGYQVLERYA